MRTVPVPVLMRTYTPPTSVEIDVIFLVRGVVLCVYIILSINQRV